MSADSVLSENATYFIGGQKFKEVNDYPLMNSFHIVVAIEILYLSAVLKILPDFMKNREPFKLKTPLLLYNFISVIVSVYFVYLGTEIFVHKGLIPTTPIEEDVETRKKMIYFIYLYYLSKKGEFIDTIFFVLRKKYNQVTFLHVYHHAAAMIGSWVMVKYAVTSSSVFAFTINSLVHVVMYFYYGVSALGPQYAKYLTWKKYITSFQLVQFACVFLHQFLAVFIQRGPHPIIGVAYILYTSTFLFYLFYQFYKQSYNKSKKVTSETQNGVDKTNDEKLKAQ